MKLQNHKKGLPHATNKQTNIHKSCKLKRQTPTRPPAHRKSHRTNKARERENGEHLLPILNRESFYELFQDAGLYCRADRTAWVTDCVEELSGYRRKRQVDRMEVDGDGVIILAYT